MAAAMASGKAATTTYGQLAELNQRASNLIEHRSTDKNTEVPPRLAR